MTKITAQAVRFVRTRDAATSLLRKLGLKPRDYDFFIEKTSDGQLAVQVARAEAHLKSLPQASAQALREAHDATVTQAERDEFVAMAAAVTEVQSAGRRLAMAANAAAETKQPRAERVNTCSAVARALIRAGKTNAEVWAAIKTQFNLDDKKRGYPAWYRADLRKQGEQV